MEKKQELRDPKLYPFLPISNLREEYSNVMAVNPKDASSRLTAIKMYVRRFYK